MKKLICYLLLYVVFSLAQFFFSKYLNIAGIFPNLILIVVVYLGLSKGSVAAQLMGFLFGWTWDVFSMDIFGIRAVVFTVVGYLAGAVSRNFNKSELFSQFVIIFFAGVVYWLCFNLICFVFLNEGSRIIPFVILLDYIRIAATALAAHTVFYILDRWLISRI